MNRMIQRAAAAMLTALFGAAAGPAQDTAPPTDDAIQALQTRYRAERAAAVQGGVAARFLPAFLERADALAQKAEAARAAGRFLQAAEGLRQARWQLPYQSPETPTAHLARILGSQRLRHLDAVYAVAFSPDGQTLATASADQTVKLWDLGNGHEVRAYAGHGDEVRCAAYRPGGKLIASAGHGPTVKLWDPATGKDVRTLKLPAGTAGTAGKGAACKDVTALAFSRDGKYLVAAASVEPSDKEDGPSARLACFDVETGDLKRTDEDFRKNEITSLAFTADGKVLAAATGDGQVRLWQYPNFVEAPMTPAYWMKQHEGGAVYAVAFSPDGQTLACASPDGVRLYPTVRPGAAFQVNNPRLTLRATTFTKALVFSNDGKGLFTGSADGVIRAWDPENGQPLGSFKGHAGDVRALAFNPAGNQLASAAGDYVVRLWDFDLVLAARDFARHDGPVWSAAFSPDGGRIVTASADKTAKVWDLHSGKAVLTLDGHHAPVTMALFSPDGKYLASVGADKTLRLWDPGTGAPLRSGSGHTATITSLDISRDGRRIVTGGADRRVKLWDAATAKEVLSIEDNPSLVASVALAPDGKQIAAGNVDQTICLYDAATGKLQHKWVAHGVAVNSVAYSPDGQLLASGGNDKLVRVWPLATPGTNPVTLEGHDGPVSSVAFDRTGRLLASASGDQLVKLWRIEGTAGKELQTFRGHKDWVSSVAFHPEGFYLASAGVDRLVKVWEITTREAPLLAEHTAAVSAVAVSPDGKQIASGGYDRTIRIWDRATGAERATLRGPEAEVTALAYSPARGTLLLSSGTDRAIHLWDATAFKQMPPTAEQAQSFLKLSHYSSYLFVVPDGKRLLSWYAVGEANLSALVECYELPGGKRLYDFKELNRQVHCLAFAAGGKFAATGAADGSVRIWKLEDNRAEMIPGGDWSFFPVKPGDTKVGVADVALTPDGATLVVTSKKGEVKIADVAQRSVRKTFTAHEGVAVLGCLTTPDGKRFVTLGGDNTIKVWDLATGKELRRWQFGSAAQSRTSALVQSWAFTPDGRQLVTANADTTVFILDLP